MRSSGARPRRARTARLLLALGAAAQLAAMLALASVDPLLEYAIPAPDVGRAGARGAQPARADSGLEPLIEAREDVEAQLGDAVRALSVSGVKSGAAISFGGETRTAALRGVDARFLETCPRPRISGRWMDAGEIERGVPVAVLDEDLAFALFGSEPAEGREIDVEGARYRVIGTLRHRRGVGEADGCSAWVPLRAASRQGIRLDALVLHALTAVQGLDQSFSEAMRAAWGPGELHNLRKERMGALLPSRLLLCGLALTLALHLARRLAARARRWRRQIDALRDRAYARRWLGPALARALGAALGAALLLAAVWIALRFAVAPAYSFPEWVPESLVSLSAIRKLFWDRVAGAARLIRVRSAASARIAFWGALDRAGAVAALLGLALRPGKIRSEEKAGNQTARRAV